MVRARIVAAAAVACTVTVSGCAGTSAPPPAGPVAITPETNAALGTYLSTVRTTRPGAFAVSPDGRNSFYSYCETIRCVTPSYTMPALRGCERLSGTPCIVLFVRDEPRLAFSRSESGGSGGRHGSEKQREVDFELDR